MGTPAWPSLPDQQLVEARPAYGPPVGGPLLGGPTRTPGSTGRVIAIVVVVVVLGIFALALLAVMAVGSLGDPEQGDGMFVPVGEPLPGRMVDPGAPPTISNPPADIEAILPAIDELVQFVFTPNPDPAAWEAVFTDPTGLRARIEPFAHTLCAVGVGTQIVSIEFLDEHRALVEFVFLGPNIPEIGRTFAFRGHVRRAADGRWLAEPDLVENVAGLASGFCLQQDVTSREGLEDDTDGTGTHDPGTLVEPRSP
ncbi:MAG: hypothetical protein M3Z03_12140 [Actinomycetota bacterium]|nr:hypothetical protein [Actinomycetota bacterium]